jgi:hypothetical protein
MTTLDTIVERQKQQAAALALSSKERQELYRLRSELSELKRELVLAKAAVPKPVVMAEGLGTVPLGAIAEAIASSYATVGPEAKTIGFKMPEDLRLQLLELVEAYQAKSYKHLVLACIRLGVDQLKRGVAETAM